MIKTTVLPIIFLAIGALLIQLASCSHPQRLAPECLDLPAKCR
jgi:hypothetical protein